MSELLCPRCGYDVSGGEEERPKGTRRTRPWRGSLLVRRGKFYIQIKSKGKWVRRCTGFKAAPENKAKAERVLEEVRDKLLGNFRSVRYRQGVDLIAAFRKSRPPSCEGCGWAPPAQGAALHVHHVLSRAKGGSDEPSNLLLVCPNCHAVSHALRISDGREAALNGLRMALGTVPCTVFREEGTPRGHPSAPTTRTDTEPLDTIGHV